MAFLAKLFLLSICIVASPSYAQTNIGDIFSPDPNVSLQAPTSSASNSLGLYQYDPKLLLNQCACSVTYVDQCKALISRCMALRDERCLFQAIAKCLPDQIITQQQRQTITIYIGTYFPTVPYTTDKPSTLTLPTIPTSKPKVLPDPGPIVDTDITIRYDTGNNFLDLLISMLETLDERKIGLMIRSYIGAQRVTIDTLTILQNVTFIPEVVLVEQQILFLISKYSSYQYNKKNLLLQLSHLRQTNTFKYLWLTKIIELIFSELKITTVEKPTRGNDSIEACNGPIDVVKAHICERYCTNIYGGNWIMIQSRREDFETTGIFEKGMESFKKGFGTKYTGYWMGLDCIHKITSYPHEMLVEITTNNNVTSTASYETFAVGSEASGYKLAIGRYLGGAAGNALAEASGRSFIYSMGGYFCLHWRSGGWWFPDCLKDAPGSYINNKFGQIQWANTTARITATRMFMRRKLTRGDVVYRL